MALYMVYVMYIYKWSLTNDEWGKLQYAYTLYMYLYMWM